MDERSKDRALDEFGEKPANEFLTTNQGVRVEDDQNSLKQGAFANGSRSPSGPYSRK